MKCSPGWDLDYNDCHNLGKGVNGESRMSVINANGVLGGKVAMITGASRGIGDALARRYAMEGARVVVSARTVQGGDHYLPGSINETVADIVAAGGEAIAVKADLALAEDRQC